MRFVNQGFVFIVVLICCNLQPVISQQQGARKGRNVAGRNNVPIYSDGQMSRIERVKMQERQRAETLQDKVEKGTVYKDYLFTVQGVEEFMIHLPLAQQVAVRMYCYHILDGAYVVPTSIDNQLPINVNVYQNHHRLIHQSQYFFQNSLLFNGQQHSSYTIEFQNSGSEKLIVMSLKMLTQVTHVNQLINRNTAENHALKAKLLLEDIKFLLNAFERYTMINFQSVKSVLKGITFYFYWHMIQTLFAITLCFVQIISIRKICKRSPII